MPSTNQKTRKKYSLILKKKKLKNFKFLFLKKRLLQNLGWLPPAAPSSKPLSLQDWATLIDDFQYGLALSPRPLPLLHPQKGLPSQATPPPLPRRILRRAVHLPGAPTFGPSPRHPPSHHPIPPRQDSHYQEKTQSQKQRDER
jgi:hypothetical protein